MFEDKTAEPFCVLEFLFVELYWVEVNCWFLWLLLDVFLGSFWRLFGLDWWWWVFGKVYPYKRIKVQISFGDLIAKHFLPGFAWIQTEQKIYKIVQFFNRKFIQNWLAPRSLPSIQIHLLDFVLIFEELGNHKEYFFCQGLPIVIFVEVWLMAALADWFSGEDLI